LEKIEIKKRYFVFGLFSIVLFYGLFQDKIDKYIFKGEETEAQSELKVKAKTDSVIGPILRRDIFSEYVDQDPVDDFVQEFCDNYKCTYVNVNLFHNGVITESGIHLRKMSCIAEGLGDGKLDLIHRLQDWVIKPFKKKFRVLKKNGYLYIPNLKLDKDPYFRVMIPRMGIESVFYVALYDKRYISKNGKPHFIGFTAFIWDKPTNFNEGNLVAMKKEVDHIREFLIDEKKVER
ncbi:unnamed protein product, partial [marine sediment metagenome]